MIIIQILNHGFSPEDLDPRNGAKMAAVGMRVQHACLDVVAPGHLDDRGRKPGDVIVDMPFNVTLGGGKETPLIVLVEILAWPDGIHATRRAGAIKQEIADAIGNDLAKYYANGRPLHVSVRGPDADATWSR